MPFFIIVFCLLLSAQAQAQSALPPGLLERIDGLDAEVRSVTGQNEQLQFKIEQLEKRLQALEKQGAAPQAATAAPPTATASAPQNAAADGQLSLSATELYNDAFTKLRAQDFAAAETGFSRFLQRFPKDELAGNAQYWLAETFYVRADYSKAVEEFLTAYRQYPKGSKAPDSLLKLGLSLNALGNKEDACKAYSRLHKEYSDAPATIKQRATSEQQKLSCK